MIRQGPLGEETGEKGMDTKVKESGEMRKPGHARHITELKATLLGLHAPFFTDSGHQVKICSHTEARIEISVRNLGVNQVLPIRLNKGKPIFVQIQWGVRQERSPRTFSFQMGTQGICWAVSPPVTHSQLSD